MLFGGENVATVYEKKEKKEDKKKVFSEILFQRFDERIGKAARTRFAQAKASRWAPFSRS